MDNVISDLKHCVQCGRAIVAHRKTKKFCSGACRQSHYRGDEPIELSDDDKLDLQVDYYMDRNRKIQP